MRFSHMLHLCRILDGFQEHGGVRTVHSRHMCKRRPERIIDDGGVQQDPALLRNVLHIGIDIIVRLQDHSVRLQSAEDLFVKCFRLRKEQHIVRCHDQIRQKDRIARDIAAAQIQKPCNVIDGRQDMVSALFLFHCGAKLFQLIRPGLSGVADVKAPDLLTGQSRTVLPDLSCKIQRTSVPAHHDAGAVLLQDTFKAVALSGCHAPAVKSQDFSLFKMLLHKPLDRRNTLLAGFHQGHGGILQLILRLKKISSVRPQPRSVHCHKSCPCGAGEAGQEPSAFEIITHILRAVEVVGRHEIRIDPVLFHLLSQCCQSLGYTHVVRSFFLVSSVVPVVPACHFLRFFS